MLLSKRSGAPINSTGKLRENQWCNILKKQQMDAMEGTCLRNPVNVNEYIAYVQMFHYRFQWCKDQRV